MKRCCLIILAAILPWFSPPPVALAAQALVVLTEENAPFNYTEGGTVRGLGVDLLAAAMREAGMPFDPAAIQMLPWARAYDRVQKEPNTILFSMARTAEREPLFAWAGPIYKAQIGLLGAKSRGFRIRTSAELVPYRIATVREGAPEQLLLRDGVPESALDRGTGIEANVKKLISGRVDLVAFNIPGALHALSKLGGNPADYTVVYVLRELDLQYAFNRGTDPGLIGAIQAGLDRVRAKGEYEAIVRRHIE